MKSVPIVRYVLLLTVVIVSLTPFHQNNIIHMLSIIFISVIWFFVFYKSQNDLKKHDTVIERVEKLKKFSIQLQSLINKELALVQEDVIRTRQIVSDSIGMLQNSTMEINNNMSSKQKNLEAILAALECEQPISMANVKGALNQPVQLNADAKKFDVDYLNSIESINLSTKKSIEDMMVALQFEDIVGQISERVAQHVGDIRSTVDILSNLCESEFSATFEEDIDKMQVEYSSIKDKLLKISSKNLAAQKNMDEGDIELF